MKKTILIVLGVILGIVVVSGTTYMITKNLLDKGPQTEKEPEENNNSNNEPTNNEVTLTKEELETYLEYVPKFSRFAISDFKDIYNLSTIESEDLVNNALEFVSENDIKKGTCIDDCPDLIYGLWEENGAKSYDYIEASFVNNLLSKMYNLTLDNLKINSNTILTAYSEAGNICPVYLNGNFAINYCQLEGNIERKFQSYTATNEELIIYSYDDFTTNGGYVCHINDRENCVPGPDVGAQIDKEKDLSLCKHTFKKNDIGYYWYSTEIVK